MTELHADNLSARLKDHTAEFEAAKAAGDWAAAWKLWLRLMHAASIVIAESRGARIEADALATELQTYRLTRADQPPAPALDGYMYVATSGAFVCAAVEHRKRVEIKGLSMAADYSQDHYAPDPKTVCGRKTAFPVNERFASGGWPRMRELCPDCVARLAEAGAFAETNRPAA